MVYNLCNVIYILWNIIFFYDTYESQVMPLVAMPFQTLLAITITIYLHFFKDKLVIIRSKYWLAKQPEETFSPSIELQTLK